MSTPAFPPGIRAAVAAALLLALPACGSKDKKGSTTPSSSGSVTTEDTGDTELMGDGSEPGAPDEEGSPYGDGAAGGEVDGEGGPDGDATAEAPADGAPATPPEIAPPDLDLSAADQQQRVAKHLRAAWKALRGSGRDPDLAITEARSALAADATNVDAVVVIALAYYHKRLYDTAEVVLDMMYKERKTAKNNPGVFYVYGLIYDRTDRPDLARDAFQKSVALAPSYKSALVNVGAHHLRSHSYEEAIGVFERLTGELGLTTAVTWTNLGSAYRGRSGDYPVESPRRAELLRKAETAYKRALSADRNYKNAYYNLGLLYFDAEPFPGPDGAPVDKLARLERAKTYFDEYRTMSGADIDLVNRRTKDVDKLIKRERKRRERARKKKSGADDF